MHPSYLALDPVSQGLSKEGVIKLCEDSLARAQTLADEIRALADASGDDLSWEKTFAKMDLIKHAWQEASSIPQLMTVTHPNADVRAAATTCEPKVDAMITAFYLDDALASVFKHAALAHPSSKGPHARLMEKTLREYRRNGLELDASGRKKLTALNENITLLGQEFERHLAETTLAIEIKPEQLDGLPDAYKAARPVQKNGLVRITTDYPDYVPFLRYAHDRKAARELYILGQNRAADKNLPILDQLLALRNEKAKLLGYATWADYVLEPRMAKTSGAVKSFLDEMRVNLKPKAAEEFQAYQELALELLGTDGPLCASDAAYLDDKVCAKRFAFDSQHLSEYFEIQAVQQGIFEMTTGLFGITFQPVDAPVWHKDVHAYELRESDGTLLGRFYLDLYPREDKYKHAAVFGLRETMKLPNGERLLPIAALVCNFPQPGKTPALMSHEEVTTFFHEFGHLLHHLVSASEFASFAGTHVARDFVEAPSQMFEEWAWRRETLDVFARHYQTGERIPDALFGAMTKARTFGEAISTQRQLFLATLDQTYHTLEPHFDTTAILEELHPEFSPFERIPGTHFQATFGHLVGYDAAYYGYQWALSLAFDLLTRFETEGMLNPKTAAEYRKAVLEKGGSEDEAKLIEDFLGRASNPKAYQRYLGISERAG